MGTNRTTWSRAPSGRLAASTASGTAISTDITAAKQQQPERGRQAIADEVRDVQPW